jgi:hypothetical protein
MFNAEVSHELLLAQVQFEADVANAKNIGINIFFYYYYNTYGTTINNISSFIISGKKIGKKKSLLPNLS